MKIQLLDQIGSLRNLHDLIKFNHPKIIYNDKEFEIKEVEPFIKNIIESIKKDNIAYHFIKDLFDDKNNSFVTIFFIWLKKPQKVFYLINWNSPRIIPQLKCAFLKSEIPEIFYKFIIDDNWKRRIEKPLKYYNYEIAFLKYRKKIDEFFLEIKNNYEPYFSQKNFHSL